LKAGLEVSLCDVDANTLDFSWPDLERSLTNEVLCVIPTHLLGYPADVERARSLCRNQGVYIIEDVAQAFGARHGGRPLGTLGDVALFSFGRGKDLSCGSGGVVVTNSDELAEAIRKEYERLPQESLASALLNWCRLFVMKVLINPWVYWLPAGLPFLKLGETEFYPNFPMARMDSVRAALLCGWPDRLAAAGKVRRQNAEILERCISAKVGETISRRTEDTPSFLKLPILLKTPGMKTRLCTRSKQEGLGISPLYPGCIQQIPELRDQLASARVPMSQLLAERLVTLPTHHLVSPDDMKRVVDAMEKSADQGADGASTLNSEGSFQRTTTG
jgi:dTDP-4-amino-4,6-dideoxygalactose transaminase